MSRFLRQEKEDDRNKEHPESFSHQFQWSCCVQNFKMNQLLKVDFLKKSFTQFSGLDQSLLTAPKILCFLILYSLILFHFNLCYFISFFTICEPGYIIPSCVIYSIYDFLLFNFFLMFFVLKCHRYVCSKVFHLISIGVIVVWVRAFENWINICLLCVSSLMGEFCSCFCRQKITIFCLSSLPNLTEMQIKKLVNANCHLFYKLLYKWEWLCVRLMHYYISCSLLTDSFQNWMNSYTKHEHNNMQFKLILFKDAN